MSPRRGFANVDILYWLEITSGDTTAEGNIHVCQSASPLYIPYTSAYLLDGFAAPSFSILDFINFAIIDNSSRVLYRKLSHLAINYEFSILACNKAPKW